MIMLDQGAFAYFRPFVRRLTGPYLVLQLDASRHDAFTDDVWLSVLVRRVTPGLAAALAPGSVNAAPAPCSPPRGMSRQARLPNCWTTRSTF